MVVPSVVVREFLEKSTRSWSEMLLRNPVASVVVTAVVLAVLASLPSTLYEQDSAHSWLTVVVLVFISYGTVMSLLFPRVVSRRPDEVLGVMWAFALTPTMVAWVFAYSFGTPRWILGVGFVLSVAALIAVTSMGIRARPDSG